MKKGIKSWCKVAHKLGFIDFDRGQTTRPKKLTKMSQKGKMTHGTIRSSNRAVSNKKKLIVKKKTKKKNTFHAQTKGRLRMRRSLQDHREQS